LYLSTDGYMDQNNEERKKIGSKRFVQLISQIADKSIDEVKVIIENHLDEFQNGQEQRDDITVVGVRIML